MARTKITPKRESEFVLGLNSYSSFIKPLQKLKNVKNKGSRNKVSTRSGTLPNRNGSTSTSTSPTLSSSPPPQSADSGSGKKQPPVMTMIEKSIEMLGKPNGSQIRIIKLKMAKEFKVDTNRIKTHIKNAIKRGIEKGTLVQTGKGGAATFNLTILAKKENQEEKKPGKAKNEDEESESESKSADSEGSDYTE